MLFARTSLQIAFFFFQVNLFPNISHFKRETEDLIDSLLLQAVRGLLDWIRHFVNAHLVGVVRLDAGQSVGRDHDHLARELVRAHAVLLDGLERVVAAALVHEHIVLVEKAERRLSLKQHYKQRNKK